jgi:diguanylate cyclase (GGDEF)-like protein
MAATLSNWWWRTWTALGGLAVVGYFFLPPGLVRNVAYDIVAVVAAITVAAGARLHRPAKPVLWYLFAAANGVWAFGDALYTYNLFVLGKDDFPSIADPIYLLAYPVFAAGLFVLIRGRTPGRDRAGLLDACIIATGLALLTWAFLMRPTATDETITGVERLVSLAYPAGDVLLIAMAARLFTTPGARTASYRLLAAALILLCGSDIVYSVLTSTIGYNGGAVDAGWLLSYVAWGAAALHPSMRSLSETAPDKAARLTRRRLALLTATSLLAPAILIHQGLTEPTRVDWLAVSIGAIVLFLLVLARMSGLVSQVQDQAAQLDALAHNDALTGVPNRRAWDLELARHLANARRSGTPVVVALLDLDHFKRFNDQYGHQAGDRLLKEASAAWKAQLRSDDLLARYGGEEFGVCLPGMTPSAAVTLLDRIRTTTPLGQTFSAGIACWTGEEAPERLVARADEALYQAKRAGRNRVLVHNGEIAVAPATVDHAEFITTSD